MPDNIGFSIKENMITIESIFFFLSYSFFTGIIYISFFLSLNFNLNEIYLILLECIYIAVFLIYIEILYRNVQITSRLQLIRKLFYSEINKRYLRYTQILTIYMGGSTVLMSLIFSQLGFPLLIDTTIVKNVIAGLIVLQSSFWVSVYYFVFKYIPDSMRED